MSRIVGSLGMGLALALLLAPAPGGTAAERDASTPPAAVAGVPEGELSGREIYRRLLLNRFRTSLQHLTIVAVEPDGHQQEVQMLARWKDYRDEHGQPQDGVIAKSVVRFLEPFDMRRTTYLVVARDDRTHDQYFYSKHTKRVRRILLRGVGILGTDYTLDDLVFHGIDDAEYERLPDDQVSGVATYVVRARMRPELETRYPLTTTYIDQERYVPLRTLYHDADGVLLRELLSNVESIEEFDGVWIATASTMRDVRDDTSSTMVVHLLRPNPELDEALFNNFRLREFSWQ